MQFGSQLRPEKREKGKQKSQNRVASPLCCGIPRETYLNQIIFVLGLSELVMCVTHGLQISDGVSKVTGKEMHVFLYNYMESQRNVAMHYRALACDNKTYGWETGCEKSSWRQPKQFAQNIQLNNIGSDFK